MKTNLLFVFDFETWGRQPATCEVVQVAGLALDPHRLRVVPGSEFASYLRPVDVTNYQEEAIQTNGITPEMVKDAPERGAVWQRFAEHVRRYNPKGNSPFTAPIPCGKGMRAFDLPIANRLCVAHGIVDKDKQPNLFHQRLLVDLEDDFYRWFCHLDDIEKYSLDAVRDYLGIPRAGAHDARVDVRQTSDIVLRFLGLYRGLAHKVKFKDSFAVAGQPAATPSTSE
jgi:DNA polymerase III epsilon subunit-like protein